MAPHIQQNFNAAQADIMMTAIARADRVTFAAL